MNFIRRFINQNRRGIIIVVAIIAFVFIIIPVANDIEGERQKRQYEKEKANKVELTEDEQNLPTKSIIGASSVSLQKTKANVKLIEQFVEKCNNKDVAGAYNMLTDECKKTLFQTVEDFERSYYKMIFSTRKLVDMENFICVNNRYTYYAKFYDDILATGNLKKANYYNDYITIDDNSQNGKISINSLICKKEINKTKETDGIKITILTQEIYKGKEKYEIKIENNTDKTILIDTRAKSNTLYLIDENSVKYGSNIAEIASIQQRIPANYSRTFKFGFNKIYSVQSQSKRIAFTDIVPDYEKYREDKSYNNRVQISIEI